MGDTARMAAITAPYRVTEGDMGAAEEHLAVAAEVDLSRVDESLNAAFSTLAVAGAGVSTRGPQNPHAAILVAILLGRNFTHVEAAETASVGVRTVERWVASEWWYKYREKALRYFIIEQDEQAMVNHSKHLADGDPAATRWHLERRRPEFAPPARNEGAGSPPAAAPLIGRADGVSITFPARGRAHPDRLVNEIIVGPQPTPSDNGKGDT